MEFAGQDLRNIILAVLARHPEGLPKARAYDLFKREFIERGNEWPEFLDEPCGAGQLDKPQWLQNVAGVTAAMARQGLLDRSVPHDVLRLAPELPDEVLPLVAVAVEPSPSPDPGLVTGDPVTFGDGSECVYAWAHASDRGLAQLRGEARHPIKSGYSTDPDPRRRIAATLAQGRTALHSGVELLLVYRTGQARKIERAVHAILDVRGHKIAGGLGQEWYRTNAEEIIAAIELITGQPR
jgi:hypothetical protein